MSSDLEEGDEGSVQNAAETQEMEIREMSGHGVERKKWSIPLTGVPQESIHTKNERQNLRDNGWDFSSTDEIYEFLGTGNTT